MTPMHKTLRTAFNMSKYALLSFVMLRADLVVAQTLNNPTSAYGTLEDFIFVLITVIQWVALPTLAVCLVYAGFQLVSAGGDEKKVSSGKLWLYSSLIGAAIVLSARVIAEAIFGTAELLK